MDEEQKMKIWQSRLKQMEDETRQEEETKKLMRMYNKGDGTARSDATLKDLPMQD